MTLALPLLEELFALVIVCVIILLIGKMIIKILIVLVTIAVIAVGTISSNRPPPMPAAAVADSNIFMDIVPRNCRQVLDTTVLSDPSVKLFVPAVVYKELNRQPSPTQQKRITPQPGKAMIFPIPDGDLGGVPSQDLVTQGLGLNDMKIIQAAEDSRLPLLTTDERMIRSVQSRSLGKQYWPHVNFIVPC